MNELWLNPLLSVNRKEDFVVGISLLVIGVVLTLVCLFLHWWFKNQKNRNSFKKNNRESQGIWEFTKKNFLIFLSLFFLIMAITGVTILIN